MKLGLELIGNFSTLNNLFLEKKMLRIILLEDTIQVKEIVAS